MKPRVPYLKFIPMLCNSDKYIRVFINIGFIVYCVGIKMALLGRNIGPFILTSISTQFSLFAENTSPPSWFC